MSVALSSLAIHHHHHHHSSPTPNGFSSLLLPSCRRHLFSASPPSKTTEPDSFRITSNGSGRTPNYLCFPMSTRCNCSAPISATSNGLLGEVSINRRDPVDGFLEVVEFLLITPCAISAVGFTVYAYLNGSHAVLSLNCLVNRFVAWQLVMMVGAIGIGVLIRRRRWRGVLRGSFNGDLVLLERMEKLEEDVRSSATLMRMLSRHLEKLGIRFRVTRKTLKEPVQETAALSQKNSEATRALTIQQEILENELGEVQKVLLAMQEQQQKQLDLIFTIAKASQLRKSKQDRVENGVALNENDSVRERKDVEQVET